jgi:hypothetical protein
MPYLKSVCLSLFLYLSLFNVLQANINSAEEKVPFNVPMTADKIVIDAKLDEPSWQKALPFELNYETDPGENISALVKTEVLVMHDDKNIYFALRCYDPEPSAIRAWYADRDNYFFDDLININLDTFNDERRNYFFGCNPFGIQRDGIETPFYTDMSWDAIWDSAGRITDIGYIIEMAIPFSSLQFQRTRGPQVWGLDISRWYQRLVRHRLGLVPLDRNNNSYQSQFLKIKGFEGVRPGKNLEINPTLTSSRTDERESFPSGSLHPLSSRTEVGITAKWGVSANFTLSGAINPDFSQVEADAQQLDINQPFALFYEEKRPFFVEGMDFFLSPFSVVYTRTMRDPEWGIKLTGKESGNTIGAYFVRDSLTNLIFPGSQDSRQTSMTMASSAGVFRYKRDIGSRTTFGLLLTDREGESYFNRLLGLDGVLRFNNRNTVEFQVLGSQTKYPDSIVQDFGQPAGSFNDKALDFSYQYQSRNLNMFAGYSDVGKNFRADLGFMPQVDYRQYRTGIDYQWINSRGWWSVFLVGGSFYRSNDQKGNLLRQLSQFRFLFRGTLQSGLNFYVNKLQENYAGQKFDMLSASLNGWIQPMASLFLTFNSQLGDRIDYDNARLGMRFNFNASILCNLGKNVKVDFDHTYEKMNVNDLGLYSANISQGSLIIHLNAKIFLRSILQYVNYSYNVSNYTVPIDPKFKHFFTQLLFSYKINPRTVLFLGYSDNSLGSQDFRLTQTDRTFFLKIGYAWQL